MKRSYKIAVQRFVIKVMQCVSFPDAMAEARELYNAGRSRNPRELNSRCGSFSRINLDRGAVDGGEQ